MKLTFTKYNNNIFVLSTHHDIIRLKGVQPEDIRAIRGWKVVHLVIEDQTSAGGEDQGPEVVVDCGCNANSIPPFVNDRQMRGSVVLWQPARIGSIVKSEMKFTEEIPLDAYNCCKYSEPVLTL